MRICSISRILLIKMWKISRYTPYRENDRIWTLPLVNIVLYINIATYIVLYINISLQGFFKKFVKNHFTVMKIIICWTQNKKAARNYCVLVSASISFTLTVNLLGSTTYDFHNWPFQVTISVSKVSPRIMAK